jgi:hypothetical protein
MKHLLRLILLISSFCFSQNNEFDKALTYKTFKKINNPINNLDSLEVTINNIDFNFKVFDEFGENKMEFLNKYFSSVFYHSNEKSKNVYYLRQWNADIKIYFDKSFPKNLKNSLSKFLKNYNGIKNLQISVVNNIDDANYLILDSKEIFFDDYYDVDNEQKRLDFVFNNGRYSLIGGNRKQIKGCKLKLNTTNQQSTETLKKNLNQLFFLSLGRFFLNTYEKGDNRLLNKNYKYSEELSELDLALLKIHYNVIYTKNVNSNLFRKIIKPIIN